jgi:hypothetical protein
MKYHYQIIAVFGEKRIVADTSNPKQDLEPFDKKEDAEADAMKVLKDQFNEENYYIEIIPVAENVEEEDMLEGHAYPGHETWND